MGEYKAGKLLLGLSIYFISLIVLLTIFNSFASEYNVDELDTSGDLNLIDYQNLILEQNGLCSSPRYDPNNGNELNFGEDSLLCEFTTANVNINTCTSVSGCSLENDTFLFFLPTNDQYCGGFVNLTDEFGINETLFSVSDGFRATNVSLSTLLTDKTQCDLFGFTWYDVTDAQNRVSQDIGINSILLTTSSLFSFQATFTDNVLGNAILTIILFYIPFVALLIALYFALPFLH